MEFKVTFDDAAGEDMAKTFRTFAAHLRKIKGAGLQAVYLGDEDLLAGRGTADAPLKRDSGPTLPDGWAIADPNGPDGPGYLDAEGNFVAPRDRTGAINTEQTHLYPATEEV